MILLSIISILVTTVMLYIKWKLSYWKRRNVYTPPLSFPLGNVNENVTGKKNIGIVIADAYRSAKSRRLQYVGIQFIFTPVFIPVDPYLIRKMVITDFQYFTDHSVPVNEKLDPLNANLFNLTGAKWKALRTKLTPLFTSGKLKVMFQTLVDCTKNFHYIMNEIIEQRKPLDIKDTFARYTTDIIGAVAFGIDCNCLKNPNTEFRAYGRKIVEVSTLKSVLEMQVVSNQFIADFFRVKVIKNDVENFFIDIVKETIEYREKNHVEKKDFMQLLMNLRNQELKLDVKSNKDDSDNQTVYYQNGLSVKEIAAQSFVFFVAGFETSSTTLNFLMYELVQHQDIQDTLRDEIKNVLNNHNGNITYEAIQEMTYLDKCVNETLRKYPPLPRVCTKDYKVPNSDLIISKGTTVMIPIYGIQHDPEFFPNPEKFDPERFSDENKNKLPPCSFLPFGERPRACICLRMGLLQTKVGLVALLKDYKFTLNHKTATPIDFIGRNFILFVKGGVWLDAVKV